MYIWGPVMIPHQHKRSFTAGNTVTTVHYEIGICLWIWRACNARVVFLGLTSSSVSSPSSPSRVVYFLHRFSSSTCFFTCPPLYKSIDHSIIHRAQTRTHARARSHQTRVCKSVTWHFWLCSWIIHMWATHSLFHCHGGVYETLICCFVFELSRWYLHCLLNPNTRTHRLACL